MLFYCLLLAKATLVSGRAVHLAIPVIRGVLKASFVAEATVSRGPIVTVSDATTLRDIPTGTKLCPGN